MRRYLEFARETAAGCAFVFHRNGHPIKSIRGAWKAATEAAGMKGLLFHDMRRSAIRNMVRNAVPEKLAMAVSGHRTRDVFERYNIISESDFELLRGRLEPAKEKPKETPKPQ
jgi:integrase